MPKKRLKKIKIKSAIHNVKFYSFLKNLSDEELSDYLNKLNEYTYWWLGNPTIERISNIKNIFPFLDDVLRFDEVLDRLNQLSKFENDGFGVHINDFMPELLTIRKKLNEKYQKIPSGIRKAELWLLPIAMDANASPDIEAAVYFASRNHKELVDSDKMKDSWHRAICSDIVRGRPIARISKDILERAKSNMISLAEAAEVLKFNDSLPRFFSFRDEEEDYVDAAFFRATEWFEISGFEKWLDSMAHEASITTTYGLDQIPALWWLFHWCRSDLAIKMTEKIALDSILWTLMNGTVEKNKPWRLYWQNRIDKKMYLTDYIPIAGILPFIWHRINPNNINYQTIDLALKLLMSAQMKSGAWTLTIDSAKPDIMATCFAIHGLALAKPKGWKAICEKGAKWLRTQQTMGGYWHIDGGPAVMITVLVLDSIALAEGAIHTTFNYGTSLIKENAKEEYESIYDFSNESYYYPQLPKISSLALNEIKHKVKPVVGLIVATGVELEQALQILTPLPNRKKIIKVMNKNLTYYIGKVGSFESILMLCNMGSEGPNASALAIEKLINTWDPKVLILSGIAFGMNRRIHLPGDVLIGEYLIPYESQRVGGKIIFRSPIPPASPMLINRLKNALDWTFHRPDKSKCQMHFGPILSGSKLVDNEKFKQVLLNQYPNAIGGEMEGSGLWSSASNNNKEWILIKSVCDWGDGKKHSEFQKMAAASAMSVCLHLLKDKYVFDGI